MMTYCKYSSSDCKHQDIQLFQFIHLHPLSPREHIIYAYISIYLKKEKEKRSSSPGNKSLCDVGIRRDSETEVLEMHHILRIQSRQPIQHIGVSLMLLTYSFCFFFFFFSKLQFFALLRGLSVSPCGRPRCIAEQ